MEGSSSSRMSKNSSATRQASAPPPKVDPCMPGAIAAAAFSLAMITPSGSPQASGLAATIMSGMTPAGLQLIGEVRAGPPTPHWISSKTSSALWRSASSRALRDVLGVERIDAALALNPFEHDARGVLADGRFQRRDVVGGHELHARQQRLEILAVLGLSGDRQRAERAAVEGVVQRR